MDDNIILLPNVIEDIKTYYNMTNLSHIKKTFIYLEGLLFDENPDGSISIYGSKFNLRCNFANEDRSLRAFSLEKPTKNRLIFSIEKNNILKGNWSFIDLEGAEDLPEKTSFQDNFLQKELSRYRRNRYRVSDLKEYRNFESYWRSFEKISQIEELLSEKEKEKSRSYINNIEIDYKLFYFFVEISNSDYRFKKDDLIKSNHLGLLGSLKEVKGNILVIKSDFNSIKKYNQKKEEFKKENPFDGIFIYADNIGSLAKINREKEALRRLFEGDTVNKNLKNFLPDADTLSGLSTRPINKELFNENFDSFFNKNQKEAIIGALSAEDLYIIQGPPGTGKTTVISEIVSYLVKNNKNILLASETNLAVDNILKKVGNEKDVRAIRIGQEDRIELSNENFLLENRVLSIKENIKKSMKDSEKSIKDLNGKEYSIHKFVKEKLPSFFCAKNQLEYLLNEISEKEIEENNLKIEIDRLNKLININPNFIKKEEEYKDLIMIKKSSSFNKKELIFINRLILTTSLNDDEITLVEDFTHNLNRLDDLIGKISKLESKEKTLESMKEELESSYKAINKNIENINYRINFLNPDIYELLSLEEDLNKLIKNMTDRKKKLKSLEIKLSRKKKLKNKLIIKTLDLKDRSLKLKLDLDRIMDGYRKEYGEISIVTFLSYYEKLIELNHLYPSKYQSIKMLDSLDEYMEFKEYQNRKKDLLLRLNKLRSSIKKDYSHLDKLSRDLDLAKEASFLEYLELYGLSIETIDLDFEVNRCEEFIRSYYQKKELKKLLHITEDLRREWYGKIDEIDAIIEDIYLEKSNLICSTCSSIASSKNNYFSNRSFDYVIIDEAARSSSKELLVPIIRGETIILVGDHKQISPRLEKNIEILLEEDGKVDFNLDLAKKSLFSLIYEKIDPSLKSFLNQQFRMDKEIASIVSHEFYDGRLVNGDKIQLRDHGLKEFMDRSIYWIDTKNTPESLESSHNKSYLNKKEVQMIISYLNFINNNLDSRKSLGIISPYRAQLEYMEKKIQTGLYENLDIEINTIDGFQGREKDLIFFSLVRNNKYGNFGHISQDSRLNVALSRAKELLLIFGSKDFVINNKARSKKIYGVLDRITVI